MKRMAYVISISVLILFSTATLFATGEQEKGKGPAELVFWTHHFMESDVNSDLPREEWYIYKALDRFHKANPEVKVELVFQDNENFFALYKTASIAKNGPDVSMHYVGGEVQSLSQFLLPLNDYFSQKELDNLAGIEPCYKEYKPGGDLLGIPIYSQVTGIYYNKALFNKTGLGESVEFKDIDELFSACDKLKTAGIQPFSIGDREGWNTEWFAANLYQAKLGPNFIYDIRNNKDTFLKTEFIESYRIWNELYERGYSNKDVISLTYSDGTAPFKDGKVAMSIDGVWSLVANQNALGGDDLGYMRVPPASVSDPYAPSTIGAAAGMLIIANYSAHQDEAIKFVKFMSSDDEQIAHSLAFGEFPNSKTAPEYLLEGEINQNIVKWLKDGNVFMYAIDIQDPKIIWDWAKLNPLVFAGRITPEEFAQQLEDKRKSIINE